MSEFAPDIEKQAKAAEEAADLAIGFSELPGDHPTLIALNLARDALNRIRLAAEMEQVPKLDQGML